MRRILLITGLICLVASGAMAAKVPAEMAKTASSATVGYAGKGYLFEGFEGAFPPAGWKQDTTGAFTWGTIGSAIEGNYSAHVQYDDATPQDETLSVDYTVEAGDDLFFWSLGNQYWAANANFTVSVNGDVVYDLLNDTTFFGEAFVWYPVQIDLAAYEGMNVTVEFNYAGLDGADQHIDAVTFGIEGWVPPAPDDVDFCDMLIDATGTGTYTGSTCDGVNLIESLDCGDFAESGLEDYYEVYVPAGGSFTASVTNEADGALWVVAECLGVEGVFNCLAYADNTLSGSAEEISYTNSGSEAEYVYLVIDSYDGSCGAYTMEFQGAGGAVATDEISIDAVKAMYR